LPEIASRFDPAKVIGGAGSPAAGYFALAAIPARYALERGDWRQAAQLTPRETPFPQTEAMTWFARGLGSARLGQLKAANDSAVRLKQIREQLVKAGEDYWALQVEIQERELRAWAMLKQGQRDEALREMRSAVGLEDGTEKSAMTPGPLAPAHELMGEMLLETNQPDLALMEFEAALKTEPSRFRALYGAGRAAELAERPGVSRRHYGELLRVCVHSDTPGRQELIEAKKAVPQNHSQVP